MIERIGQDLPWRPFTIPRSSPPVVLAPLHGDPAGGSFLVLVRFPAGWGRPVAGHYSCDEEFVVLEGELTVSGILFGAGDRGWFPAGRERTDSRSDGGALALAWFSGPAHWVAAE
ncbi:hypothetical protein ACFFV7_41340 [Nonomuraea spiralis]|uniref:Cupin domain-containing protein n=1 Tax=Nonomuraea spiralis TaxID=46182 RepID=A0ABV5IUM6_9ACTN|nr:hypothetical protein [Nonomuraea spiralis]GGT16926.1 hypothetical protein GCM10010176_071840 [Nonomuraea spiralis]